MKTLLALVLLTLICFLHHSSGTIATNLVTDTGCCAHFNKTLIPKGRVKHVGKSSSMCSHKAIVFTTVCDEMFCFEATMVWAKKRLEEFKNSPALFNKDKCSKAKKL